MDDEGGEEYFHGSGSYGPLSENETIVLFRDLEHELQVLTQRYHVPPEDLAQLFQVHTLTHIHTQCWGGEGRS